MKNHFRCFAIGLSAALFLLASVSPAQAASTDNASGSELRFRLTADPATLDWNLARSSHETYIIMNVMEGLTEAGVDLKPRPALAEKWEVTDQGKTFVFHLRPDVKWSDGRALKASDFVDSWLRLLNPKTKSSYASYLFDVVNAEAYHSGKIKNPALVGVQALNDSQLQVRLNRIVPYFLHIPTFWVTFPVRADLIQKNGKNWATPGKIATLGPYLLSDWKKGRSITLTRNRNYYGKEPAPSIDKISAKIISDDREARTLFTTGQIDLLLDATTEDLVQTRGRAAQENALSRVEQFPYLATYYLGFNVKSGPLKDTSIRRAVSLGIEREAIPALLQGGQTAAKGWVPPGIEGHGSEGALTGTLYDARGALTRAGYGEGQGFPSLRLVVEKFDGSEAMAQFISRSLRERLGIQIEAQVAPPEGYQALLRTGKADIFVGHWGADFPDPADFFEVFSSSNGTNWTGWKNQEYDKLLQQARSTYDMPARLKSYSAAEKILLQREVTIYPLFYRKNTVLLGARIGTFEISPLNYLFFKSVSLK